MTLQQKLKSLTKQIFIDDFYLAQSGHENWCLNVFKILEKLNLEYLFYERKMVDIKEIKDQLMNKQSDMWKQAVPKKLNYEHILYLRKPWILKTILNTICHPLKDLQWHNLDLEFYH